MEVSSWINYIDVIMCVCFNRFLKKLRFPQPFSSPGTPPGRRRLLPGSHPARRCWRWWAELELGRYPPKCWEFMGSYPHWDFYGMFMDDVHGNSLPTLFFSVFRGRRANPQFILHFRLGKNPWNQRAGVVPPWLNSETSMFRGISPALLTLDFMRRYPPQN